MSKNLLVEISRIQELMGIQDKGLIMEQGIMPFVKMFLKKGVTFEKAIDDAADLLVSSGKMSRAEVDEAIKILKNEKALVDDINRTYKKIPTINDNVRIQTYIDDLIKRSGSKNLDNFIQKITTLTQKEVDTMTSEGVKWLLANQKWEIITRSFNEIFVPDIIKLLEGGFNLTKVKLNLTDFENAFSSFCKNAADDFVEKYKNTLQKMYDEKTVDKKTGKVFIKTKDELDKLLLSADKEVGEPVFEYFKKKFDWRQSDEISSLIEDYKKLNKIDDSAPSISKPIYGKNNPFEKVKELDEEGKSFFRGLDDSAETSDNFNLASASENEIKILDELGVRPPVTDQSEIPPLRLDDIPEETADDITAGVESSNPFFTQAFGGKSTYEINDEIFRAYDILNNTIENMPIKEELRKPFDDVLWAIRNGKRINPTPEQLRFIRNTLSNNQGYADVIENVLQFPRATKMGPLNRFYWGTIEPLIYKYRQLLTTETIEDIISTVSLGRYSPTLAVRNVSDNFDDFLRTLENKLVSFEPQNLSNGEIKQLKDKFLKLQSGLMKNDPQGYYNTLYKNLDEYLRSQLRNSPEAYKNWVKIQQKFMEENGDDWRYVAWKNIINDPSVENRIRQQISDIENKKDPFQTVVEFSPVDEAQKLITKLKNSKPFKKRLLSLLVTGSFRTPEEMMQFMIKNGYGRVKKNIVVNGQVRTIFNVSAGGANFLLGYFWKNIITPFVGGAAYASIMELSEFFSGNTEYDNKGFVTVFYDSFINGLVKGDFLEDFLNSDEFKYSGWYQIFEPILDVPSKFSPLYSGLKTFIESRFMVDKKTVDEKIEERIDETIDKLLRIYNQNPEASDKKIMYEYKEFIITMSDMGIVDKNKATEINKNMSVIINVTPQTRKKIKDKIKQLYKGKEAETILDTDVQQDITQNKIVYIVVNNTKDGTYVLSKTKEKQENFAKNEIVFLKPKYKDIISKENVQTTIHKLNELEF